MDEAASSIWSRLAASGEGDGNVEVPSAPVNVDTGFGPVRYAVGPGGEARLLVPSGGSMGKVEAVAGANLHVGLSFFTLDGRNTPFIDVMLLEHRLGGVFEELVGEILNRIREGHSPAKAVGGAIADFRALLQAPIGEEVPENKVVGLIGELIVLDRLCTVSPEAVSAWVGPYEQRHDFRRLINAIEVKTSSRSDAKKVVIHGAEQLLPPRNGIIHLVHVRIEKTDQGDLSVATMIDKLLKVGAEKGRLSAGLVALGCLDAEAPEWNRVTFSFEGLTVYRVDTGFPRITPLEFADEAFPPGVTSLEYGVDLSTAATFRLDGHEAEGVFMDFMA
ncbi:PD-(D/E)XK motif protein [Sinisalibacter aestuarii]|uniref:PD-(D/E)XK motif protein n=1 Tax=Sinisalibacter aestuarii TaxID=2949426 RepID=A0ABQ5LRQ5_9RHOB|nr:PD-(D/E)XK motif protein [Sinisalibacter aestuarii]GKY87418.1 hypothetical protein STA1M1_12870 [Sinisalibacter aestuarii]